MAEPKTRVKRKQSDKVSRWVSQIGGGGRVVVPAELRASLGLKTGDKVVFEVGEDGVRFKPHSEIVRDLQNKYSQRWKASEFSAEAFLGRRKALWGED